MSDPQPADDTSSLLPCCYSVFLARTQWSNLQQLPWPGQELPAATPSSFEHFHSRRAASSVALLLSDLAYPEKTRGTECENRARLRRICFSEAVLN